MAAWRDWELKQRYALWYPVEPIICPACHRKFRGRYERTVPYHHDNSERGVCWGSRQTLNGSAHKYPGSLYGPLSTALAEYATRQLRRGAQMKEERRPSSYPAYDILRFTVERDRVHEVLGYQSFEEYFQIEVHDFNASRRSEGGFVRRLWRRIRSRPPA